MKQYYFFSGNIYMKTFFGGMRNMPVSGLKHLEGTPEEVYQTIENEMLSELGGHDVRMVFTTMTLMPNPRTTKETPNNNSQ
jgi:hypothetical protein